jgi:hypothetical protein
VSEPSGGGQPLASSRTVFRTTPMARWLAPTSESRLERIPCRAIDPRPWPPATSSDDRMVALTRSVRQRGVVEPLLLRPAEGGRFQVVLGSRRLEAALRVGLSEVPAIVRELDEAEATLLAAWSILPRMDPEEMVEVASRLCAAGVSEPEVAVMLGTAPAEAPRPVAREWTLLGGSAALRFAGAVTPVRLLLDALGERRASSLLALRGTDPERLA